MPWRCFLTHIQNSKKKDLDHHTKAVSCVYRTVHVVAIPQLLAFGYACDKFHPLSIAISVDAAPVSRFVHKGTNRLV